MGLPGDLGRQELIGNAGRKLLRHLALRLKDGTDADDLAQEAYLRLLRADESLVIRDPRSFALRVATHVAYEWGRLARHRREHIASDVLEEEAIEEPGPYDQLLRAQNTQIIHRALSSLTPVRRAILLMHIRDELTYAQIAERVQLSVSMVGKHLMLALVACRAALTESSEGSHKR